MTNVLGPFRRAVAFTCGDGGGGGTAEAEYVLLSVKRTVLYWAAGDTPTVDGGNRNRAPRFAAYLPNHGRARWTPDVVYDTGPHAQGFSFTPPGYTGFKPFGQNYRADPRAPAPEFPLPLALPALTDDFYLWYAGDGPLTDPEAETTLIVNAARIRAGLLAETGTIGIPVFFGNGLGGFFWELRYFKPLLPDVPRVFVIDALQHVTLQDAEEIPNDPGDPFGALRRGEVEAFIGSATTVFI
jgi:hypothetical protein